MTAPNGNGNEKDRRFVIALGLMLIFAGTVAAGLYLCYIGKWSVDELIAAAGVTGIMLTTVINAYYSQKNAEIASANK